LADLEGLAKRLISKGLSEKEIKRRLVVEIKTYKDWMSENGANKLVNAVLQEARLSSQIPKSDIAKRAILYDKADAQAGLVGVGCRGEGDFFVHRKLAEIANTEFKGLRPILYPMFHDDAGAVLAKGGVLVVAVDGMHSRLSDFPFLAGFHATRATLRDVMVKGAKPLAIFIDLHIADDGDVAKLFDYEAGVSVVSNLSKTPIVAGSTLRIGGDMVIGDRITGCVGSVGIASDAEFIAKRAKVKEGSVVLMTEGAGGGTICTTAIYSGRHDVVEETLNIQFINACSAIINNNLLPNIYAMTDVTNGGIRADAVEISTLSKVSVELEEERIKELVNKKVLRMLEDEGIDYLGVSLDSLLIFCPKDSKDLVISEISKKGVKIDEIGRVKSGDEPYLIKNGKRERLRMKFRESAYTKIKKVVGEESPENWEELKKRVERAFRKAIEKRDYFINMLSNSK
jgi:hydrogenase expression/formation protein